MQRLIRKFSYKNWMDRFKILREKIKGVDFSKSVNPEQLGLEPDMVFRSSPSGNNFLKNVLESLDITEKDKILDIGCGKGSAMLTMLSYPFACVDGIEISMILSKIAKKNFKKLKINRCRIFSMDATEFNNFDIYNYIYFYNPFPSIVMDKVMYKLTESVLRKYRKVTIIYNNPVCHQNIITTGIFSKLGEYPDKWGNGIYVYTN